MALLQRSVSAAAGGSVNIISSFEGHDYSSPDDLYPPDTQIAAGQDHVVEVVNSHMDIFTKQGQLLSSETLRSFFVDGNSYFVFNPKVLFDADSGRFFASVADSTNRVVRLAVSATSDPTGEWFHYSFSVGEGNCPDKPLIGYSDDKFVISTWDTTNGIPDCEPTSGQHGQHYFVIDKNDLISGSPSVNYQEFGPISTQQDIHPVQSLSSTDTVYMVGVRHSSIELFTVSGSVPNAEITSIELPVTEIFPIPWHAEQPDQGTVTSGDAYSEALDVSWYKDRLWVSFNDWARPAGSDGDIQSIVRFVEIDTTSNTVLHDIRIEDPHIHFFFPAISIDEDGNLIAVFGYSSETDYPSLAVSGKLKGENSMLPWQTLKEGSAPNQLNRYGDYFGAGTDPSDPSVVWVAGQYVESIEHPWSTYIGGVTLGNSPPPPPPPEGCVNGLCSLTVNTENLQGNAITGYWTVLSQNGATVATGFSPATFTLNNGENYVVSVADYGNYRFDHWENSTASRERAISLSTDESITAVYKNINEPVPAEPDFTISASPSSIELPAMDGKTASSTITISSLNGFNSEVALSIVSEISGLTTTIEPATVTPASDSSAASTLTITSSSSAAPGTYQLLITGTAGSISHSTTLSVKVTSDEVPAGPPKVTVRSVDIGNNNNEIFGYYTTLSQNGAVIATGFTPATFDLTAGHDYEILVYDYGSYFFNYWIDNESRVRERAITAQDGELILTAGYGTSSLPPPPPRQDFTISADPSSLQVTAGDGNSSSATSTITIGSLDGFSSDVSLSVSPTIEGVSASFEPNVVTPSSSGGGSATSTLTVSTSSSSAAAGDYRLTVTGTNSGSLSHSTSIDLTISSGTQPPTTSKLTVNTQDVFCNTIAGYYTILYQNGNAVSTGFSPAQFTLDNGQQYSVEVQDYGSFAFSHWEETDLTTRNRPVSISSDTSITAIYKNLNDPAATGPCSIGDNSNNGADFAVSVAPSSVTVEQGSSVTSTISVASINGFSSPVTLSASSIEGLTTSFNTNQVTPPADGTAESLLTISADSSATPGTYQIVVTGTTSDGSLSHSDTISVTIPSAQDPDPNQSTRISVKTVDSAGGEIFGYYATLWQNGVAVQSGFSPVEFAVSSGQIYQVAVSDYGQYVFDHWSDGSTDRFHDAEAGDSLTAVYRP